MAMQMIESLSASGHLPARDAPRWAEARNATLWPARFEVLHPKPLGRAQALVIDVAHNEPAVEALLASASHAWPGRSLSRITA